MSRPAGTAAGVLTGPGEPGKTFPTVGAALSAALTRAARPGEPCSFYVRDPDGNGRYAVERIDTSGAVVVHTTSTREES